MAKTGTRMKMGKKEVKMEELKKVENEVDLKIFFWILRVFE